MTGQIKYLNFSRQFGFVTADSGEDVFFHSSGYAGDFERLQKGDRVTFETEASPKGPRARQVELVPLATLPEPAA